MACSGSCFGHDRDRESTEKQMIGQGNWLLAGTGERKNAAAAAARLTSLRPDQIRTRTWIRIINGSPNFDRDDNPIGIPASLRANPCAASFGSPAGCRSASPNVRLLKRNQAFPTAEQHASWPRAVRRRRLVAAPANDAEETFGLCGGKLRRARADIGRLEGIGRSGRQATFAPLFRPPRPICGAT
jgi:hypothetical protein